MPPSSALISQAASTAARADELASAKEATAATKASFLDAELQLIMGATASDDAEIKALGRMVINLRQQIADAIEETDTGRRALLAKYKAAEAVFEETAAAGNDVKLAYKDLQAAKAELGEKSAEIRELSKIEKEQLKALHAQFKGLF